MATNGQLMTVLVLDSGQYRADLVKTQEQVDSFTGKVVRGFGQAVKATVSFAESHRFLTSLAITAGMAATGCTTLQVAVSAAGAAVQLLNADTITAISTFTLASIELGKLGVGFAEWSAHATGSIISFIYHHQYLLTALGLLVPALWPITAAVGAVMMAYRLTAFAINEVTSAYRGSIDGTGELIPQYNALHKSAGKFRESLSELGSAIATPFVEGATAIKNYIESFSPLPTMAAGLTAVLNGLTTEIKWVTSGLKEAAAIGTTAAFILTTGASNDAAASFYEQGKQLEALAKESERVIAKQEAMRPLFEQIGQIQKNAKSSVANASEVSRIGKITGLEEIDNEIRALQQRANQAILNGKADEEWMRQTKALFEALERQRQGIVDGTVVDKKAEEAKKRAAESFKQIEDAIKAAQRAADELEFGKIETQLRDLAENRATQDQIKRMREALKLAERIRNAREDQEKLDKTRESRQREATQLADSLKSPAEKLKDQLDKITQLQKEGFYSQEQADALRQRAGDDFAGKAPEQQQANTKPFSEALMAGSREAGSAILRAMAGSQQNPNKKLEEYAARQLIAQEAIAASAAALNKMEVADF